MLKFRRTLDQDLIKVRAAAASLRSSVRRDHSTSSKKSVTFEDEANTLAQSHQTSDRLHYSQLLRDDRSRKVNIKRVLDSVGQELILTQDFEDGKRDDL